MLLIECRLFQKKNMAEWRRIASNACVVLEVHAYTKVVNSSNFHRSFPNLRPILRIYEFFSLEFCKHLTFLRQNGTDRTKSRHAICVVLCIF